MSQENVEIATRWYEPATSKQHLFLGRDGQNDGVVPPKVEWTVPEDGTTYRGREGVSRRLKEWLESFDDYSYEVQRIIDCGGNEVLVEAIEVGRGAASGAEVRSTNYELLTIRDGMIVRIREFYNTGDAFEAAELRG